jgi:hypothetical protein
MPMQPWIIDPGAMTIGQMQSWMKGCLPAPQNLGSDGLGAACQLTGADTDGLNCASQLCIGTDSGGQNVSPYCSSFCCSNADCGSGFVCDAAYDSGLGAQISVCVRL